VTIQSKNIVFGWLLCIVYFAKKKGEKNMKNILWRVFVSALVIVFVFIVKIPIEISSIIVSVSGFILLFYFLFNLPFKGVKVKNEILITTLITIIYYEVLLDVLTALGIDLIITIVALLGVALIVLSIIVLYVLKDMSELYHNGRRRWKTISRLDYAFLLVSSISIVSLLFLGIISIRLEISILGNVPILIYSILVIFSLPVKW
jgi:hypothetical protein